jgi:hypothetical protein
VKKSNKEKRSWFSRKIEGRSNEFNQVLKQGIQQPHSGDVGLQNLESGGWVTSIEFIPLRSDMEFTNEGWKRASGGELKEFIDWGGCHESYC